MYMYNLHYFQFLCDSNTTYSNTVNNLFISVPRYWKGLSALSPPVSVLGWALCSSGQLLKSTAPAAPPPHSPLQYRSRLWHRPD